MYFRLLELRGSFFNKNFARNGARTTFLDHRNILEHLHKVLSKAENISERFHKSAVKSCLDA
jgi:hypothetical protein